MKKVERRTRSKPVKAPSLPTVKGFKPNALVLAALKATRRHARGHSDPIHPFIRMNHPPGVFPQGHSTLAMDDGLNSSLNWAASSWNAAQLAVWDEGLIFPGYPYLAAITQRSEYRRPSEIIATAMTRKGWRLQSASTEHEADDPDKSDKSKDQAKRIKAIMDELDRLKAKSVMRKLIELDGFFGRSHLYLEFCDPNDRGELRMPIGNGRDALSKRKVSSSKPLLSLKAIEPTWCYPTQYNSNDPLSANWYHPDMWFCMAKEIHSSRFIKITSREVPDLLKPAYSFGGLALSQMMKPYVDNWIRTRQSVSDITHNFSTVVLKSDLATLMQGNQLLERLNLFNVTRDNQGAMLLDKETEDFAKVSAPLNGLDSLQAQAQEQMSSPCGIPLIILFGITPTGLNTTSEGEITVFDDWVGANQEAVIREPLTRIIDFIQLSLYGDIDQDIILAFEPLRSLNDKELAETRKVDAETDMIYVNGGVLGPEEIRERIASDPDTPYQGLDVDALPDPPAMSEESSDSMDSDEGGEGSEGTDNVKKAA